MSIQFEINAINVDGVAQQEPFSTLEFIDPFIEIGIKDQGFNDEDIKKLLITKLGQDGQLGLSKNEFRCLIPEEVRRMKGEITERLEEVRKIVEKEREDIGLTYSTILSSSDLSEDEIKQINSEYRQKLLELDERLFEEKELSDSKLQHLDIVIKWANYVAFFELYAGQVLCNLNEEEFVQRFCSLAKGVLSEEEYDDFASKVKNYCQTSRDDDMRLERFLYDVERSSDEPFVGMSIAEKAYYLREKFYDTFE